MENLTFEDNDDFQRKKIAENAIKLLRSEMEISPLVIDGEWGTGKTQFCFKFIKLMEEEDTHELIYVDAFKADHSDEPLLTVLAEVTKIIPKKEQDGFIKKILPTVRYSIKTFAKAGVAHILKKDAADIVDEFDKEIQKAADKAIDASVESLLKDHVNANKSLKTLQDALKEIARKKPIIIFIDELDRCRPNFAISILEIIKHTFHVEGIQFVLITNTQQLKASINHCYGNINSQRYLDKFLNFIITLPNEFGKQGYDETQTSVTHYLSLIKKSQTLKATSLVQNEDVKFIAHIIKIQKLSLREIETFVRHLEIYQVIGNNLSFDKKIHFGHALLTLLSITIFCFNPELAASILHKRADAKILGAFLGEKTITKLENDDKRPEYHQAILVMLGKECHINDEIFTPSTNQDRSNWNEEFKYYYSGSYSNGKMMDIVINTLKCMSLSY